VADQCHNDSTIIKHCPALLLLLKNFNNQKQKLLIPGAPGAPVMTAVETHSGSPPYRKKARVAKSITFNVNQIHKYQNHHTIGSQLFYNYFTVAMF